MESKTIKVTAVFPIVIWMILNITLVVILLLNGDTADFNNWLEIGLWSISIVGLVTKSGVLPLPSLRYAILSAQVWET